MSKNKIKKVKKIISLATFFFKFYISPNLGCIKYIVIK